MLKKLTQRALPYVAGLGFLLTSSAYAQDTSSDAVIARVVVPKPLIVEPPKEGRPDRLTSRLLGANLDGVEASPLYDIMHEQLDEHELVNYRISPDYNSLTFDLPIVGRVASVPIDELNHKMEESMKGMRMGDNYNDGWSNPVRDEIREEYQNDLEGIGKDVLSDWGKEFKPMAMNILEESSFFNALSLGNRGFFANKFKVHGTEKDEEKGYGRSSSSNYEIDRFSTGFSVGGSIGNPSVGVKVRTSYLFEVNLDGEYELKDGLKTEAIVPLYRGRTREGTIDLSVYGSYEEEDGSSAGIRLDAPLAPITERIGRIFTRKKGK